MIRIAFHLAMGTIGGLSLALAIASALSLPDDPRFEIALVAGLLGAGVAATASAWYEGRRS